MAGADINRIVPHIEKQQYGFYGKSTLVYHYPFRPIYRLDYLPHLGQEQKVLKSFKINSKGPCLNGPLFFIIKLEYHRSKILATDARRLTQILYLVLNDDFCI